MVTFIAYINETLPARPRTFKKKTDDFMNGIWHQFNRYAKKNGFFEEVESGKYLGSLAWKNPRTGAILELRKATDEDLRYLATPTPEIITTDFQFAHGRMPRGGGSWAFYFGKRSHDINDVWFAPYCKTWPEAKKLAQEEGRRRGVSRIYLGS